MLCKKIVLFLISLWFIIQIVANYAVCANGSSGVCMLSNTGEVLFAENKDIKLSMASTTKIMTCLLACESGRLNDKVKITSEMVAVEGSSMGLRVGNIITLENIVRGMMLLSGNDAAKTVAIYLCGSEKNFAEKMNDKAKLIGMKNTHFVTSSGLDDDEHYSTAYDMALLGSFAMKNPLFRTFVENMYGKVTYIEPKRTYTYRNHNKFLDLYDGCCGIKTGFTKKSGRCLVTAVKCNDDYLVTVTLNNADDWAYHSYIYDKCLPLVNNTEIKDNFLCKVTVTGGVTNSINAKISENVSVSNLGSKEIKTKMFIPKFLYAPIKKGDIIGFVRFYYGNKLIKQEDLISTQNVKVKQYTEKKDFSYYFNKLFGR